MTEEYKKTVARPSAAGDTHDELKSHKTYDRQAGGDWKSAAEEYRGKAEQVWSDAKDRARTFQEESKEYVRENPIRVIFGALGIGFILGLMFRR